MRHMEDDMSRKAKVFLSNPAIAWIRVNRFVSMTTATKIAELLGNDHAAPNRSASR